MAGAWSMSFKVDEELPGGDEQGGKGDWEGEYKNGLHERHNGGIGHG